MQDHAYGLTRALASDMAADEAFAAEFTKLAADAEAHGDKAMSSALTSLARVHSAEALQMRVQLDEVRAHHGGGAES